MEELLGTTADIKQKPPIDELALRMGGSNHGRDSLVGIIEGGEDLAEAKWVTAGCRSGIRGFTGSSKLQHACETDSSEVDALLTHAADRRFMP